MSSSNPTGGEKPRAVEPGVGVDEHISNCVAIQTELNVLVRTPMVCRFLCPECRRYCFEVFSCHFVFLLRPTFIGLTGLNIHYGGQPSTVLLYFFGIVKLATHQRLTAMYGVSTLPCVMTGRFIRTGGQNSGDAA